MAAENIGVSVPDQLKQNLDWYISHQQELSVQYSGRILLIVNQKLISVFDDLGSAWEKASQDFEPGTFTLQPCSPGPDSYTLMLFSPGYASSI